MLSLNTPPISKIAVAISYFDTETRENKVQVEIYPLMMSSNVTWVNPALNNSLGK